MNNVLIVIPVYKNKITHSEQASLIQAASILHPYKFVLLCPEELDIQCYESILQAYNCDFKVERFDAKFFDSVQTYSKLMLSLNFYKRFEEYEYMLVYQLDAWVFRDELKYWCNQGFDYIGAPWFEGFDKAGENSQILEIAGNGGFSLRKISAFIDVLTLYNTEKFSSLKVKTFKEIYNDYGNHPSKFFKAFRHFLFKKNSVKYYLNNAYEDLVVVKCFRKIKPDFKLADYKDGLKFSFEVNPERLYIMNNRNLPFGCHAFMKYNLKFWKQHIGGIINE